MSLTYLLDVNLLLALADPAHVHHEIAHRWFGETGRKSWATCPLTENGFVRVASHPNYPNRPGDVLATIGLLRELRLVEGHQFWPDDLTIVELLAAAPAITHAQITDVYLLGLAVRRKGRLATLDRRVPVQAIAGGPAAFQLITE